jgi:hypothetical protein
VNQPYGNAGMHQDRHPTKNSQDNEIRYLILVIARTGDQIIMIDLADETKIPRY